MNDLMITCFYAAGKSGGQKTGTSQVDTAYLIHCAFNYEPSVSVSAAEPASRSLCFMSTSAFKSGKKLESGAPMEVMGS